MNIEDLRRFAVGRSLFPATTLKDALDRIGFVQADPIRAPARAQDLTLRHRVEGYRAGDLERGYEELGVAEDVFVNYGFVTRELQALMHSRPERRVPAQGLLPWSAGLRKQAERVLEFVQEQGQEHPREVNKHFSHGRVVNYWGGSSNATTQLLDAMHYRGVLRVVRREGGIRIYAAHEHGPGPVGAEARRESVDALVDAAVHIYAPLPGASLSFLLRRLRLAAPQWQGELAEAARWAKGRLARARVDGVDWYWPANEDAAWVGPGDAVRLLAPFDPVVWDRARFEMLWGWVYLFEAYTPLAKRVRGYYALPMLWRDRVVGWANLAVKDGGLEADFGYIAGEPKERAFRRELQAEVERVRVFLGL